MNRRNALSMGTAAAVVVVLVGIVLLASLPVGLKPIAASIVLGIHVAAFAAVAVFAWIAAVAGRYTERKKRVAIWFSTFVALLTALVLVLQWVPVAGWTADTLVGLTIFVFVILLLIDIVVGWVNNLWA